MLHSHPVADRRLTRANNQVPSRKTTSKFRTFNQCKILFIGDTSFGENYQVRFKQRAGKNILEDRGYDYPLLNLKRILRQSDFVIANLEAPITDIIKSPLSDMAKGYLHWTDKRKAPKYLKKHNIKIVSLANNHTLDYGIEGLKQTLGVLRKNGMEWIGAGVNETEAGQPYLRQFAIGQQVFKLAVIAGFEYRKTYDHDFAFYANSKVGGVNALSVKNVSTQVRQLKETIPNVYVVVFPHWGQNYMWKSKRQWELAHQIIDAGADLILGHGAHMMQEIEKYNGRWILYGIGNFMFNSRGRYQKFNVTPFSLIAQLLLQEETGSLVKTMRLYPIFTDNRITNFKGRFLTKDEFEKAYKLLLEKSPQPVQFRKDIKVGKDDIGRFMEFSVG